MHDELSKVLFGDGYLIAPVLHADYMHVNYLSHHSPIF